MYVQWGWGPGRIGRVRVSKSGRTIYYGELELVAMSGGGYKASHIDHENGDAYWVSAPHQDGQDTLYPGVVDIDDDVRLEYWQTVRGLPDRVHLTSYRSLGVHGRGTARGRAGALDGRRVKSPGGRARAH